MKVAVLYVDQFEASTPPPPPLRHLNFCRLVCSNSCPQIWANIVFKCLTQMSNSNARFDGEHVYSAQKTWHFRFKFPISSWQDSNSSPQGKDDSQMPPGCLMPREGDVEAPTLSTPNAEYYTIGRTETSLQGLENNYQKTESFFCNPDIFLWEIFHSAAHECYPN